MAGVKKAADAATAAEEAALTAGVENNTIESEKAENGANTAAEQPGTVKLIYIGPTLPRATLKTNKVFIGTEEAIKKEIAPVLEKFPLVEKLLVPVAELADKKDKVRTAGNIFNKYYSDIVSAAAAAVEKEE